MVAAAPADGQPAQQGNLKLTVEQAMAAMHAKRQEEKAKAKRKKVMKRPSAKADADADEMAESDGDADGEDAEDGETEDSHPIHRKNNAPKTKKETPAHGKSGKASGSSPSPSTNNGIRNS